MDIALTDRDKCRGYRKRDVIPALWATIWILMSLLLFCAGLIGVLLGRIT